MPGKIPAGKVVREPVSHLDVYSTILDYLDIPPFPGTNRRSYGSDGVSLRRHIEGKEDVNADRDTSAVVVEVEKAGKNLKGKSGVEPNYMIRHNVRDIHADCEAEFESRCNCDRHLTPNARVNLSLKRRNIN